ncbi:hypothetical protein ACQJBY_072867 [Aegilops geniculata]
MATTFSSILCKILPVVAAMLALLCSAYARDASEYGQCFSRPECSNYCKQQGYHRGGEVMPPNFMDCCCFI